MGIVSILKVKYGGKLGDERKEEGIELKERVNGIIIEDF